METCDPIIEKAIRTFIEKYSLPEPSTRKGNLYVWGDDSWFFNNPSISIAYNDGELRASTFVSLNGCFGHRDVWASYQSEEELLNKILITLDNWAEEYWKKIIK